jgi:biotin carboxyl carrier protein
LANTALAVLVDTNWPIGLPIFECKEKTEMTTQTIKAEIAGTVWKIVAEKGAELEEDEPVLILESMKMEIPALMPEDGRVINILVAEGDIISEGQPLAEIELS